jgi:hypothetical protein
MDSDDNEFYEFVFYGFNLIAHKSCTIKNDRLSNPKYIEIKNKQYIEIKCDIIDKIAHNINIYIVDIFCESGDHDEEMYVGYFPYDHSIQFVDKKLKRYPGCFYTFEEFYDYIEQYYPHLIIIHDIKIALK